MRRTGRRGDRKTRSAGIVKTTIKTTIRKTVRTSDRIVSRKTVRITDRTINRRIARITDRTEGIAEGAETSEKIRAETGIL